jgi:hypothetical protein
MRKATPKSMPAIPRGPRPRKEMKTPHSHFAPVDHSGYEGMGNPSGVSKMETKTSHRHYEPVPHSMPAVPRSPKKWRP